MSLDETHDALKQFQATLREFDDRIRAGQAIVRQRHDDIDGLWRDSLRGQYDLLMEQFQLNIDNYVSGRSEEFECFLDAKILQLQVYLYGS